MTRRLLRPLAAFLLALSLSGCWHVPPSAIWRFRAIDAVALDPAALRLAARVPQWLEATPDSVKAKLTIRRDGRDEREFELILEERNDPAELKQLAAEALPGAHFLIFRLSAADVARIRALQAEARAARAADPNRKSGAAISLDSKTCRRMAAPAGPIMVDLYLSLGEQDGFFKIYQDVDLRELLKPGQTFEVETPMCGKWAGRAS